MESILIKPSDKTQVLCVAPKNGTNFQLEELQEFVGGYIEVVYLRDDRIMVVNEEGKLKGLEYNEIASAYLAAHGIENDYIVGNALICDSDKVR